MLKFQCIHDKLHGTRISYLTHKKNEGMPNVNEKGKQSEGINLIIEFQFGISRFVSHNFQRKTKHREQQKNDDDEIFLIF